MLNKLFSFSEESVLLQKSRKDSLMASSAMSTCIGRALEVTPPIEPTTRKDPAISVQSDLGHTWLKRTVFKEHTILYV